VDGKAVKEPQKIAQLFVISGWLIIVLLAVLVLCILLLEPSFFLWVIWFGLIYILPLPLIIWGATLFVRYRRLLKDILKMSVNRLWIETVIMNAVCLMFFWFMFESLELPLTIKIVVAIWNVLAIGLGFRALIKNEIAYN